ncbi:hypothetical protein ACWD5B_02210 [Streptomyces tanashiensis]|uniref:hypothetical protein n=1 Tax=Streptomyces tanashiensis TaxID=67367 RepID=UPI001673230A|nr:hypothetical protein [Streptomyces tanashiensis]
MAESRPPWPVFASLGVTALSIVVGILAWLFPVVDGAKPAERRTSDPAAVGTGGGSPSEGTTPPSEPKAPTTPRESASPSATPVSPALSGRTPEGWAGTWRGSTSNDEELIIVRLRAGREGQVVGTIDWPVSSCKGELTLVAVMAEKLIIHEVITEDPQQTCRSEAQIDFRLKGATLLLGGSEWGKEAVLRRV